MMTTAEPEVLYWTHYKEYLVKNQNTGKKEWSPETPDRERVIKSFNEWLKGFE